MFSKAFLDKVFISNQQWMQYAQKPWIKDSKTVYLFASNFISIPTLVKQDFSNKFRYVWQGEQVLSNILELDPILLVDDTLEHGNWLINKLGPFQSEYAATLTTETCNEQELINKGLDVCSILENYAEYSQKDWESLGIYSEIAELGFLPGHDIISLCNLYKLATERQVTFTGKTVEQKPITKMNVSSKYLEQSLMNYYTNTIGWNEFPRTGNTLVDSIIQQWVIPPDAYAEYQDILCTSLDATLVQTRLDAIRDNVESMVNMIPNGTSILATDKRNFPTMEKVLGSIGYNKT